MTWIAASHVDDPRDIGLPPFTEPFRGRWTSYHKGAFFGDGLPGRVVDGALVPHPIYAAYVIENYLHQAEATGERVFVDGAVRVARAVVRRMDSHHDAAVFWYEPSWGLSSWVAERHYSALTQSHYARVLTKAGRLAGDGELCRAGSWRSAACWCPPPKAASWFGPAAASASRRCPRGRRASS